MRIGIVGLGLIGGSLALALRKRHTIVGVDVDPRAIEQARAQGAIDSGTIEECEVVVLSTPAQALLEMLPDVAARMSAGAVLTDVCGAKERVCEAGARQDRVVFVGAHPMAGTEFRGFEAALPTLFNGATVAICPAVGRTGEAARREATARVRALWIDAGAGKLLDVEPAHHDRAVTFASHLPYLAAASVVESLLSADDAVPLARELAAGGFRDTTRLAGDGTVGGAAALNRFIPEEARALASRLRSLADELERDPAKALERLGALADERRRMRLPPR